MDRLSFRLFSVCRVAAAVYIGMACLGGVEPVVAAPAPAAVTAFHRYTEAVKVRLARQHSGRDSFLVPLERDSTNEAQLRRGELVIRPVEEPVPGRIAPRDEAERAGAMLHHWRGTAFAAGAKAADFEKLLRNFDGYPQYFAPQVLQANILKRDGDQVEVKMRVRQRHVLTVVMDATYDVMFGRLDAWHGFNDSRSTQIAEIDSPGTASERALGANEEHGFLWRLNTSWSYEERDGGLYLQVESVSLTRSIPSGLGWVIRPYVESVPQESIEFTLRSVCRALGR